MTRTDPRGRPVRVRRATMGAAYAGALAIAVVGGIWAGRAGAPRDGVDSSAVRLVHAGVATVAVPGEWRPVTSRGAAVAPAGTTAVLAPSSAFPERVIMMFEPVDDHSLVPATMRGLVRELSDPRVTRIAGHRAWRYAGLPGRNPDHVVDVSVLPSRAGVLGIACISAARDAAALSDCAAEIASVSLRGAAMLAPSHDLGLRLKLPRVLAALDRARVDDRAALARAGTRKGQARFARRLARAHLAAAHALRPVAGRAGEPLIVELSATARAYAALGRAAGHSASRFRGARRTVHAAEARLAAVIRDLARRDPRETVALGGR